MRKRLGFALALAVHTAGGLPGQRVEPPVDLLGALRAQPIEPRVAKGFDIRVVDTDGKPQTNASVTVYFYDDRGAAKRLGFRRRVAEKYRDSIMSYLANLVSYSDLRLDGPGYCRVIR